MYSTAAGVQNVKFGVDGIKVKELAQMLNENVDLAFEKKHRRVFAVLL